MSFTPKVWADGEAGGTPITAAELNRIEQGITDAHAPVGVGDVAGLQSIIDDLTSRLEALEAE